MKMLSWLSVINEEGNDQFFPHAKTELLDLTFKALICSDEPKQEESDIQLLWNPGYIRSLFGAF